MHVPAADLEEELKWRAEEACHHNEMQLEMRRMGRLLLGTCGTHFNVCRTGVCRPAFYPWLVHRKKTRGVGAKGLPAPLKVEPVLTR